MRIRSAQPADAAAITALMDQLAEHADGCPAPDLEQRFIELLRRPDQAVLVAETEPGRLLGLLSIGHRPTLWHGGPSALIDALVMDRTARGRGVGRALIEAARVWACAAGCSEIGVSTEPANRAAASFYRHAGFDEEALLFEHHFGE